MKRTTKQLLLILLFCLLGIIIVLASPLLMFWTTSHIVTIVGTYTLVILTSLLFTRLLGLRVSLGGFLAGSIAAAGSMGLIFAIFLLTGLVSITSIRSDFMLLLLAGAIAQLFVAFGEELSFRAVIFSGLDVNLGLWPAVGISSVIFALLHIPSMLMPGVGLVNVAVGLCVLLVLGFVLAVLYKCGGLLSASAFHFLWNWLEYTVLGLGSAIGMLKLSEPGSDILTGGSFGPEASVIGLSVVIVLAIAIWYYYKKKGLIGRKPENSEFQPAAGTPVRS